MIEGLEFGFRVQGFLRVCSRGGGAVRCPRAILQMRPTSRLISNASFRSKTALTLNAAGLPGSFYTLRL